MANILSYLKWRGDLSLTLSPFNEVDNLLMSALAYIDFSEIIMHGQTLTIAQAYDKYKDRDHPKQGLFFANNLILFKELAKSQRFSQARLSHYRDILDDTKKMTQFAAITIEFDDGRNYIAFRGTDDTLIGWKEDFSFGYEVTHAQQLAHAYLEEHIQIDQQYYIGGHSKGGHLAVYATLMCHQDKQANIARIYSNDGPGICFDIISKTQYQKIEQKIIKFVPQFSIVGMLYEERERITIIESNRKGIMQHDIFTWNIEGTHIIEKESLDKSAIECLQIIKGFLADASSKQKQIFTETFFQSLSDKGFKTLTDISNQGIDAFLMILEMATYSSRKSNHIHVLLIQRIMKRLKVIDYIALLKTRKRYVSMLIFLSGILFVASPQHALRIIGTSFFIWLLLYSAYQVYKFEKLRKRHKKGNQVNVCFYALIMILECICIFQGRIILISSNLVLGGLCCWRGYKQAKKMGYEKRHKQWKWIAYLIDSIVVCILGIVAFSTTSDSKVEYMLAVGSYLIIIGMIEIGSSLFFDEAQRSEQRE